MGKIIFEFDEFEDVQSIKTHMNASNYKIALQEFYNWLRNNEKSGLTPTFEEVQQNFKDTIQDLNIFE